MIIKARATGSGERRRVEVCGVMASLFGQDWGLATPGEYRMAVKKGLLPDDRICPGCDAPFHKSWGGFCPDCTGAD